MRQVTRVTAEAFMRGETKVSGNTETDGTCVWLHGNKIAERVTENEVIVTLAGWPTPTTRERLNGIAEVFGFGRPFHQKQHEQFFNNTPITERQWVALKGEI